MGDNNIEIGEKAQVRGAVGRDINIKNSEFGDAKQVTGDDLATLVGRLIDQLEALGPKLESGSDVQIELANMAQAEAESATPARSKIRALISSILGGIQEAGEAAAPAIKTVEAIQNVLQ